MRTILDGVEVRALSPRKEEHQSLFGGHEGGVEVFPWRGSSHSVVLPKAYLLYAEQIHQVQMEEGDVVILTAPKSGTTWMQEIVWNMKHNPDLDNAMAHVLPLTVRTPFLESDITIHGRDAEYAFISKLQEENIPDLERANDRLINFVTSAPHPRVIKTHLPLPLISPTALSNGKVISVVRDPRDVCLSYFHHCRVFRYEGFKGSLDQFIDAFLDNSVWLMSYWSTVKMAWAHRRHPNLLLLSFERMKEAPAEAVRLLDAFLGTGLSPEQIHKVVEYTSFAAMAGRKDHVIPYPDVTTATFMEPAIVAAEGGFFRQGKSGGWKKVLTEKQKEKFEKWISENCSDREMLKFVTHDQGNLCEEVASIAKSYWTKWNPIPYKWGPMGI